MAQLQQINKAQLRASVIDASHIDLTTIGKSLITQIIPGLGLSIANQTGADVGTGAVTLQLDTTLASLAELTTVGFLARTSNDRIVTRTFGFSDSLHITHQVGDANPVFDLSNTGIEIGTYKYLKVDEKGRALEGYKYIQTWVANEILVDTGDHINYTLANTPVNGTLMVFVSGAKMIGGADRDFVYNGNSIMFTSPNLPEDVVTAAYFWTENGNNVMDMQHDLLTPFDAGMQRYRLLELPQANSQVVFLNGLAQRVGPNEDYTMDGQDVVFNSPNVTEDTVTAIYFR
jgi:hypothetical protein